TGTDERAFHSCLSRQPGTFGPCTRQLLPARRATFAFSKSRAEVACRASQRPSVGLWRLKRDRFRAGSVDLIQGTVNRKVQTPLGKLSGRLRSPLVESGGFHEGNRLGTISAR